MKNLDFWVVVFLLVVFISACTPQKVSAPSCQAERREIASLQAQVESLDAELAAVKAERDSLLLKPCLCGGDCVVCACQKQECKPPAEPPKPPAAVVKTAPPAAPVCSAGYSPVRYPQYQPYRPLRGLFRRR